MKNKRFEISILIIIIIFSIILFGILMLLNIYKNQNSYVLFTKPFNILKCVRYECINVKDSDSYNNKKYSVFINGNYVGINKLFYNNNNDKYYAFDTNNTNLFNNDNDTLESKEFLIGVSGNVEVISKKVKIEKMTKEDYLILSDLIDIEIEYVDFLPIYKYIYDFDSDNELEILYAYGFVKDDKAYSILAYTNNNKTNIIEFKKYNDVSSYVAISLEDVIDVYNDGKIEFLLTKNSQNDICTLLYRLKGNKFVTNNNCIKK